MSWPQKYSHAIPVVRLAAPNILMIRNKKGHLDLLFTLLLILCSALLSIRNLPRIDASGPPATPYAEYIIYKGLISKIATHEIGRLEPVKQTEHVSGFVGEHVLDASSRNDDIGRAVKCRGTRFREVRPCER